MRQKVASFCRKRLVIKQKSGISSAHIEVTLKLISMVLPVGVDYRKILKEHSRWLYEKVRILSKAVEISSDLKLYSRTEKNFKEKLREIVQEYAAELGVPVKSVRQKYMKTKWGSWSGKRILTVNLFLRFLPENLLRYVVLHELVHFFEPYHTKNFYNIVMDRMPEYRELEEQLVAYWIKLERSGIVAKFTSK